MRLFDSVQSTDVDRRELQLTALACCVICVLAVGMAVLMYPVVFLGEAASGMTVKVAFVGFCVLSVLLAGYLWDRQNVIRRLRAEMAEERKRIVQAQRQASAELLRTIPDLSSFQDRLTMEFRRTVSTAQKLSILVMVVTFPPAGALVLEKSILLGDAAKVIARKLREEDSIYVLATGCFAVVLPGAEKSVAKRVAGRLAEGLADAAGVSHRFTCTMNVVNYPEDASTAHGIEEAVFAVVPEEPKSSRAQEALAGQARN
jgi:hypothetical protein